MLTVQGFVRDVVTQEFDGKNGAWEKHFVIIEDIQDFGDDRGLSSEWVSLAGKTGQVEQLAGELKQKRGSYVRGLEVRARAYGDDDDDYELVTFRNCIANADFDDDHDKASEYKQFLQVDQELREKRSEAYSELVG